MSKNNTYIDWKNWEKDQMLSELSKRHQNSQWVDWINDWGLRSEEMKNRTHLLT